MINNENEILKKIPDTLNKFKTTTPLTQCITNFVTVNDCANAILALGGSPIMADDPQEVEEIVNIANALVINIGTVRKEQNEAMNLSSAQANKTNTPITIDPVGVGIS